MNDNPIRRAVDTRLSGLAFTPQMQADTLRRARLCNQPPHMRRKLSYSLAFALLALLLAAPLAKLFAGFNIFASSFFIALGNGLISAAISFLRTLVFQTASVLILPLIFDVDGIWYAITVAEVFATLISVIFLFAKRKKYHYMECSPHGKK